jgi:DNA-binding transcriptional regulator YdaS (Cro superfamily)
MGHFVPSRKHVLTGGHLVLFYGSLMNRHAKILDGLGGHTRVASLLGMKENTVSKWARRGIPARHWHRIIALEPELTPEYLDRTKPRGSQRRCEAAE